MAFRYGLAALYATYGVLYLLALVGILDGYAVVVGCLTVHFTGLAFHHALVQWPDSRVSSWVATWVDVGPVYPVGLLYNVLVILDALQLVALVFCAIVLAGGAPRRVETEVGSLIIAYLGVVGCFAKLTPYINAPVERVTV